MLVRPSREGTVGFDCPGLRRIALLNSSVFAYGVVLGCLFAGGCSAGVTVLSSCFLFLPVTGAPAPAKDGVALGRRPLRSVCCGGGIVFKAASSSASSFDLVKCHSLPPLAALPVDGAASDPLVCTAFLVSVGAYRGL